jgi:hypothetical protein
MKLFDVLILMSKQFGGINNEIADFYEKIEIKRRIEHRKK